MQVPNLAAALDALVRAIVPLAIDAAIADGRLQAPQRQVDHGPRMLTAKLVAELYGVSESTLADWRSRSKGPAWSKPGKHVLYNVEDVESYFAKARVRTLESDQERFRAGGPRR